LLKNPNLPVAKTAGSIYGQNEVCPRIFYLITIVTRGHVAVKQWPKTFAALKDRKAQQEKIINQRKLVIALNESA